MSTRNHPDGIAVSESDWVRGGSETDAYISPWYGTTIKHRDLDDEQGELSQSLVVEAVDALHEYTVVPDG